MADKRQLNVRINEMTRRQIDGLAERERMTAGEVVTIAVDRMYREEKGAMETTDRVQQVNWLRELASNIADWSTGAENAEELVEYATSDEGTQTWDITWPSWFGRHDQELLTAMVLNNIS